VSTKLLHGDARDILPSLPDASVHCVVTSPPYFGLRDYQTGTWEGGDAACGHSGQMGGFKSSTLGASTGGRSEETHHRSVGAQATPFRDICGKCGARRIDRQIGLERTPDEYLATMVGVFREVRRVLRPDGVCWVNMGDSYSGGNSGERMRDFTDGWQNARSQPSRFVNAERRVDRSLPAKNLLMMPARLALALQADGWWLRSDIIWAKPNPMPESCTDRPTSAHEHVFMLTKSARYFYDAVAVAERVTQARVGQKSDFEDKRLTFGDDFRLHIPASDHPCAAESWDSRVRKIGVRIASMIFDLAKTQDQISLFPLDTQKRIDGSDESSCLEVGGGPVISQAAAQSGRFTDPDITAEQFLDELNSLRVALPDGDHLREAWRSAFADGFLVVANRDRAIGINNAGDVGEFKLGHNEIDTSFRDGIQTRNLRNVWSIPTQAFPGSHFATMPTALVERCIRAGTSERGCCAQCGAPWRRQTEKTFVPQPDVSLAKGIKGAFNQKPMDASNGWDGVPRGTNDVRTTGWSPGCACDAEVRPCVVLDPFMGAGTVALVCDRLQRDAIGIELNPAYGAMADARVVDDAPLLAWLAEAAE
jgi:DNA modification methylase